MHKHKTSLLELSREEILQKGEAELEGKMFLREMHKAPNDTLKHFKGAAVTVDGSYTLAAIAAEGVLRVFEQRLFTYLEEHHHCAGCMCSAEREDTSPA